VKTHHIGDPRTERMRLLWPGVAGCSENRRPITPIDRMGTSRCGRSGEIEEEVRIGNGHAPEESGSTIEDHTWTIRRHQRIGRRVHRNRYRSSIRATIRGGYRQGKVHHLDRIDRHGVVECRIRRVRTAEVR